MHVLTLHVVCLQESNAPIACNCSRLLDQEDRAKIWHSVSRDVEAKEWGPPVLLFDKDGSYDRNRILLSLESAWLFPIYYSGASIQYQLSLKNNFCSFFVLCLFACSFFFWLQCLV